jgi:CheY-like chemotaxis protein
MSSESLRPRSPASDRVRVLIVDDERNARVALAELLRDEGYAVETACDGASALPKVDSFHPDVVLTDLQMPGMNGLELVARLRESTPPPVVVVMTAFGGADGVPRSLRAGAAAHLIKPLDLRQLTTVLDAALRSPPKVN